MIVSRIEDKVLRELLRSQSGKVSWGISFSRNWELRDGDTVTLRGSLSWDKENGILQGDVVEYGQTGAETLLAFSAESTESGEAYEFSGEDMTDDNVHTPKHLIESFSRQVEVMRPV